MALSKQKKAEVISQVSELLEGSKLTVAAKYPGTSVQALQQLRSSSKAGGTQVRVIKNRLFKKALENSKYGQLQPDFLQGQLLYAFNSQDEVAPAQNLAAFAKEQPQLEFVGGISGDGQLLSVDDIKALAALPGKDQLRAQLVGTIGAPLGGFVNVLSGNVRGVLNVLNARADQLGN